MTVDLDVQSNWVEYAALFTKPAFDLWGHGDKILSGMYGAFKAFSPALKGIRVPQASERLSDQAVIIELGTQAEYRFRFDRVESSLGNFDNRDLNRFPEALEAGRKWLLSAAPEVGFTSHLFNYRAHARLSEGTSEDLLVRVAPLEIPALGRNQGTGMMFHGELPDGRGQTHFTVDHSLTVTHGVFLEYRWFLVADDIDYFATLRDARETLRQALEYLGMRLPDSEVS